MLPILTDITFDCLGHWDGPNNQKYLTLLDTRVGGDQRPHYRCAVSSNYIYICNIHFNSTGTDPNECAITRAVKMIFKLFNLKRNKRVIEGPTTDL